MDPENFNVEPWASHKAYKHSLFSMEPAPENCTSEILVSSLYRAVGFPDYSEAQVPKSGSDFLKRSDNETKAKDGSINGDTWRTVLNGILSSPKLKGQPAKRFLQLTPVVPDAALYSGAARLVGNPWNPGQLVAEMLKLGAASQEDADRLWRALFDALSVDPGDDVWARWVEGEFKQRRKKDSPEWEFVPLKPTRMMDPAAKARMTCPAKQFTKDLTAILVAKNSMTRRQWTTLLEALLRLSATTHVLWVCNANRRLWQAVRAVLDGNDGLATSMYELEAFLFGSRDLFLSYGKPARPLVRDLASGYLASRLGINLFLSLVDPAGTQLESMVAPADALRFLQLVAQNRDKLASAKAMDKYHEMYEQEALSIGCKKGIGRNIDFFAQYVLAQRQPSDQTRRGHDQGYFLQKARASKVAPWVVSMGPVAVLAMVHCCLAEAAGPRSVGRLCSHLAGFGLRVGLDDINTGDLGRTLRMLGLVIDSPDAESGMLLLPPFSIQKSKDQN